jgi:hypothetical protein
MPTSSVRLPVLATVKAAYQDVFADFPATLRALSLMFVLLVVFTEVPLLFLANYVEANMLPQMEQMKQQLEAGVMPPASGMDNKMWVTVGALAIYTLQMIFIFRFMQGWYRQWLLGENKGQVVDLRLGKGEWQLMITSIKAGLVFIPFIFIAMLVLTGAYPTGDTKAPPAYDYRPYLVLVLIGALYVQGRTALAYPITAMADAKHSVRSSWSLTKRQGARIALGNLMLMVPMIVAMIAMFEVLSWFLTLFISKDTTISGGGLFDMSLRLLYKCLAEFCVLIFVAGLSAYHARCYAYLVRTSSSHSVH